MTLTTSFNATALRSLYGHMPSGVLALGASVDGRRIGMAVSSFTYVSLDPPLIVISIRQESETWPLLARAQSIGASILAEGQLEHGRALSIGDADSRWADVPHSVTESGAVIVDDSAASFETVPRESFPAGDHALVLLELRSITPTPDLDPLLYFRSRFAGVRHV